MQHPTAALQDSHATADFCVLHMLCCCDVM